MIRTRCVVFLIVFAMALPSTAQEPASDEPVVQDVTPDEALVPSAAQPSGAAPSSAPSAPYPTPAYAGTQLDASEQLRGAVFNSPYHDPLVPIPGAASKEYFDHPSFAGVPPFPVVGSAVVLIGRVISGASFVTPDGRSVYSDFEVAVEKVLAPSAERPIAAKDT